MSLLLFYALSTRVVLNQFLTFSFLGWVGGVSVKSKNVLSKVGNVCGKVVDERQEHSNPLQCCVVQEAGEIVVNQNWTLGL